MLRALHRYQRERQKFAKRTGEYIPVQQMVRDFGDWSSKRKSERSALDDRIPWMPFEAIYRLSETLNSASRVFEWGMGGSTLFLLDHAGEVISVEHDRQWFESLYSQLDQNPHWSGFLSEPVVRSAVNDFDPADPQFYGSTSSEFLNHQFEEYVRLIDQYADESFDVIIVDGRSRPACAMHAQSKVSVGGLVVIDNAERPQYRHIHQLYSDTTCWQKIDCSGPSPYSSMFTGNVMYRKLMA